MNKVIQFFNYEQCYRHYTSRIINIKQAKMYGEESVAKPVLLLAIIDSITNGEVCVNQIKLTEKLVIRYEGLMNTYAKHLKYYSNTLIYNPFWHLQGDEFWHLCGSADIKSKTTTPSTQWLKEHVSYAYVDEALWILLQNKVWRLKLRDYIIEHKLTDDFWSGRLAAEGFGLLAAILLAA